MILNPELKEKIIDLSSKGFSRPQIQRKLIKENIVTKISIKTIERALNKKKLTNRDNSRSLERQTQTS